VTVAIGSTAVALLLFLVSDREEISHECMGASRHQTPKRPPPESNRASGTNTHSMKGSSA
jgi:hypothetical protein